LGKSKFGFLNLKPTLRFFTKQINPRSLESWCIKGTEESLPKVDYSVSSMRHDPSDLGLICLGKKCKIRFGFKNPIVDFLKEAHPEPLTSNCTFSF